MHRSFAGRCLHGRSDAASATALADHWTSVPRFQSYLISLHLVAADLTARDCGALGTRIILHVFVILNIHVQPSKSQIEQKEIFYAPLPSSFPDWAAVTTTMPAPKFKVALIQMCPKVRSDRSHKPSHTSPSHTAYPNLTTTHPLTRQQ